MVNEITAKELKLKLDEIFLIDCRQLHKKGAIHNSTKIPLGKFRQIKEIQGLSGKEIVIYCRSGVRSLVAARILSELGYNAKSLKGGILAWNLL